jgi:hypothetical protein
MSKRRRARQRQRRFIARPTPPPERDERPEREPLEARREMPRARSARGGMSRATGAPSNALLKAGAVEYAYVIKDLRRIAAVSALLLLLLGIASFVVNALPG